MIRSWCEERVGGVGCEVADGVGSVTRRCSDGSVRNIVWTMFDFDNKRTIAIGASDEGD